jgi:hypothetical protein
MNQEHQQGHQHQHILSHTNMHFSALHGTTNNPQRHSKQSISGRFNLKGHLSILEVYTHTHSCHPTR